LGDEYTERKIRVYDVKKKDGNPIVKGAKVIAKVFWDAAGSESKKARIEA
jgi:hypothetical protein